MVEENLLFLTIKPNFNSQKTSTPTKERLLIDYRLMCV
jgi:hypothetical protein